MGQQLAAPPVGVDWWGMLADPAFLRNPHPELRRIREMAPVHKDPVSGVYFVLGHREFRLMAVAPEMGRDTRLWDNGWATPENEARDPLAYAVFSEFQPQMNNMNPPDHRRMREVYEKAFGPGGLARFRPMIEAECRQTIDALPRGGAVDFMDGFANPLGRRVFLELFGIPREMEATLARWVEAISQLGNVITTPDQKNNARTALREFKAYLRPRLLSRPEGGGEGFFDLAFAALSAGAMDEDESLNNLVTLIAGGEAIGPTLGNGMLALLTHPAQLDRLRTDRRLIPSAVEEMLRYEPSGSFIVRVAIDDFQCGPVRIPAGSMAIGLVQAINRDPRSFDSAEAFDIDRQANTHQTFGAGPHVCIGKALVRMTAQAAFEALLDRFDRIELAGEPVWWTHRSDQRGLGALPLRLGQSQ